MFIAFIRIFEKRETFVATVYNSVSLEVAWRQLLLC